MGGAVSSVPEIAKNIASGRPALEGVSSPGHSGGGWNPLRDIGSFVDNTVKSVGKTAEAIIKKPLPVIETIALVSVGVPPNVAAASVSAANGGDIKQIATAYIAVSAGSAAAESAGVSATSAGASTEMAKIASSATGASTATVTSALASGQSLDKALEAGLASGALSGATTGVIEETKAALAPPETGQGIKAVPGASSQLLDKTTLPLGEPGITAPSLLGDQSSVSGLGLTDKVPTGGGQGLTVDPNIILPASLVQYGTDTGKVRGTDTGGLQPAYKSASDSLTPSSFDPSVAPPTPYQEPKTVTQTPEPVISKTEEAIAKPIISGALSEVFGLGPKIPGAPSAGGSAPVTQGATTGTSVGLTGERGAGEIESKETGQARKNVWNEASLRLKDALGV